MPPFIVLDFETTHGEPELAHIIEWAAVVMFPVTIPGEQAVMMPLCTGGLVKPPIPIPPETSAVHHIIDADVAFKPSWEEVSPKLAALFEGRGVIAVAHNATLERAMLAPLNLPCRWLCTYRAALRVWPEAPRHGNEALRYWLGFGTGRGQEQRPHTAMHDATVTAKVLQHLLQRASVEDMVKWTDEPPLLPRCPLGDWRGHPWSEVEESFLLWILRKIHDREDVQFCARMELDRREREYQAQRQAEEAQS